MRLSTSNKGWHSQWFYIKDDQSATLSRYSGRLIIEAPELWLWGCPTPAKKHLADLLVAIRSLKVWGVKGSGIIGAYHARRVAPLMVRVLPLYRMVPGESFEGTVLADEALAPSEVAQRIKEAMELPKDTTSSTLEHVYPVPGHPPMQSEPGFLEFVSFFFPVLLLSFEFLTF